MKMKELSEKMSNRVCLEVIATFADDTQDLFQIDFYSKEHEEYLKSENDLLNLILDRITWRKKHISNISKDNKLIKLSLCFFCNTESLKKYPSIQEVISKNGKYYFDDNGRLLYSYVKKTPIEQIEEMLEESDWEHYQIQRFAVNKKTIH